MKKKPKKLICPRCSGSHGSTRKEVKDCEEMNDTYEKAEELRELLEK